MSSQNFEQQVTFYHNIFVYCAIAALIFLVIAVVLFFLLKIPRVFGEMTGRDARKAIDEMMEESAKSGSLTSLKLGEDGRRRRRGRTGGPATGRLRKNVSMRSGALGKSNASGGLGAAGSQAAACAEVDGISGSAAQNAGTDRNAQVAFQTAPANEPSRSGNTQTEGMDTYGSAQTDVLDNFGSTPTDVLDSFAHVQPESYAPETEDMAGYAATQRTSGAGQESAETYQALSSETMVLSQNLRPDGDVFVVLRSIVEIHTDEVI